MKIKKFAYYFNMFLNESKYNKFIEMYLDELQDIEDKKEYVEEELSGDIEDWEEKEYKLILKELNKREKVLKERVKTLNRK